MYAAGQWRRLWPIALQMFVLVAVAVYVGGDWMPAFRFLLPVVPLGCLLVAAGLIEMFEGSGQAGSLSYPENRPLEPLT